MSLPPFFKNEIVKDIAGFSGMYSITSHGRVYSHPKRQGKDMYMAPSRFLSPSISTGYARVTLSSKGKKVTFLIHRLVAYAFLKNEQNKETVNHIDGNKLNNHLSNLEWATYSENHKHAFKLGLMKTSQKSKDQARINQKKIAEKTRKLSIDDASEICEAYATGIFSCRELAEPFGVDTKTINNLVKGRTYVA